MKIVQNLLKDSDDEKLVEITANINDVNPIIDRIMEDESVAGVVMTNKEGAPVLTNLTNSRANQYSKASHGLGSLTNTYIKEVDTLDEVLLLRLVTTNGEIMVAPHKEFSITVIQRVRQQKNKKNPKQRGFSNNAMQI